MSVKLRLLKVIVQAVVVLDDGEHLTEQATEPVSVSAAEWPTFATGRFATGMDELRRQVEGGGAPTEASMQWGEGGPSGAGRKGARA